jgi:hypothetical protein
VVQRAGLAGAGIGVFSGRTRAEIGSSSRDS